MQQFINIAKANPNFPVILPQTGGRGGSHHYFEDFHQPILRMYGHIRRCGNIAPVAGSWFGAMEDILGWQELGQRSSGTLRCLSLVFYWAAEL